jgi:hypothetical protein
MKEPVQAEFNNQFPEFWQKTLRLEWPVDLVHV